MIIIGSPSLSGDRTKNKPPHDINARNFLNVGLRRAGDSVAKCFHANSGKCCCKVRLIIYRPGYINRTSYDPKVTANVEELANGWMLRQGSAASCLKASYADKSEDILNELESLEAGSVSKLDYLGHSSDTAILVEYGSLLNINDGFGTGEATSRDYMTNEELIDSMDGKFGENAELNHFGCYGARCACDMNEKYNVNANGAIGKTSYNPAGAGGRPERMPSGNYQYYPAS